MEIRTYRLQKHSTIKRILYLATILASIIGFARGLNCSGDPCMYGICLENANSTYSCYCIDGYTGINCEINWDDCWSNPCLNGGTCNDAVAAYNCTCVEGFIGTSCEQKYSECSNQPCLNNGTCLDYDGITCQCPEGYSGDYCEIDASVCNDTICKNSGECVEGPGFSFFCQCPDGWTGRLCDQDVDECLASPCKNGGLCINVPASYTCACLFGYTGKDCDKAVVPCEENPCENGAVCLFEDERQVCYCVPDYHGALCELRYDDCDAKFANCENGGTCIDGVNSFSCACPTFYTGPVCETYEAPSSTVISSTNESFETSTSSGNASTAYFSSKSSPGESSTSSLTLAATSSTIESWTYLKSTSRSSTKWYPLGEATSPSERSANGLFEGKSSTTESAEFIADTASPIFSTTNRDRTVSLDPSTMFSTLTTKLSPGLSSTAKFEGEYLTSGESTTKEADVYRSEATSATIGEAETTSQSTGRVDGYTQSTRTAEEVAGVNETSTTRFSSVASLSPTEFWQNKTAESSVSFVPTTLDVTRTTASPDKWMSSKSWTTNQTKFESSTSSLDGIGASSTAASVATDCQDALCASPTVLPNDTECNCAQRDDCKTTEPSITRAAFNGKSYARQRVDVDLANDDNVTLGILLNLKTRFKNGIILHVYFDDVNYALVYLELGSLKFQFSCGLETMLLGEIDSPIDNGYQVDIDIKFQYFRQNKSNKCSARLLVNGTTAVSGEQILPLQGSLPRNANLHLGGIPLAFSHYFSHVAMGFVGCMDSLKVNGVARHFIHDSTETYQIEDCTSFLCLSNPCQNFGACEEANSTTRCRCVAGYTGRYCERSACDQSPCALGATCIGSPGIGFICVCPLGTHGLLCEEDTVIVRPSFSVLVPGFSSYVAYGISSSIKDSMELNMKLIPRSFEQISLIAYLGQSGSHRDLSDHLSVTYVRGYIMLTWDLGAGVRRIFTSIPLSAATMTATAGKSYKAHTLRIGRRGRDAWLAVDGIGNVTGRVVGSMSRLDVSPILYIGGHKSKNFESLPHDLPLHTGFSGCIFDIEMRTGNAIYPITSSSPATGRGVGECHRNECIRNLCKNGAVCLNHGATYSCICAKEWTGPDCSSPVEMPSPVSASSCRTVD